MAAGEHFWEADLAAIERTPRILEALAARIPAEAFERRPAKDAFSPREVVCHLAEMEEVHLERYRALAETDHPAIPVHDPDERLSANAYADVSLSEALRRFGEARAASVAYLRALPAGARARTGAHPEFGEMSLAQQVGKCAAHDLTHVADILARTS